MNNYEKMAITAEIGGAAISIHWSADCNMACQYCYIDKNKKEMHDYNIKIRQALQDGSFLSHMKEKFEHQVNLIDQISLWGAEPTINGDLFENFIVECLDYFTKVDKIMFSTNALLGAEFLYNKFFLPLIHYTESRNRKIHFELQLSLDGPPEYNDASRHPGATENTLETAYYLIQNTPKNHELFSLNLFTKITLDISYMRDMVNKGIEKFQWYFDFLDEIQAKAEQLIGDNKTIRNCQLFSSPTLVNPGYYTIEDGKYFAEWIKMLPRVNREKWVSQRKHIPLFYQCVNALIDMIDQENPYLNTYNRFSCSSGKSNYTIDWDGTLYACNRLARNAALNDEDKYKGAMIANSTIDHPKGATWLKRTYAMSVYHNDIASRKAFFDSVVLMMAKSGQIDKKYLDDAEARLILFYMITGINCHIGTEEDHTGNPFVPCASYLRLLGNGAKEALEYFYTIEKERGIF